MKSYRRAKFSLIGLVVAFLLILMQPFVVFALQGFEVSSIAKNITVSIDGHIGGPSVDEYTGGSGVIIGQENQLYQVLTAWHVVAQEGEYSIRTSDGELHSVEYEQVMRIPEADVAILEFRSENSYPIAKIGDDSQLIEGMTIYFAGYPKEHLIRLDSYPEQLFPGNISEDTRNYKFVTANITTLLVDPREGGYRIGYDEGSSPGMSGGPVLNADGELIAIHGMAELHFEVGSVGNFGISSNIFQNWQQSAVAVASPPDDSNTLLTEYQYIWPAEGMFTSGYGWRWGRMHRGIDIAGPIGTPVVAVADGVVEQAGWNSGGYGNLIEVRHTDGNMTRYAHNNKLNVSAGQSVRQGQQIAEMGATGYTTGPQLHFEIHLDAQGPVDPVPFLVALDFDSLGRMIEWPDQPLLNDSTVP